MKGLMICVLATAWVLGVIYAMSRRTSLEKSMIPGRYIEINGKTEFVEASAFNRRAFE
jgi:hypothetical protein